MKKWVIVLFVCFFSSINPQPNQFYLFDGNNSPLNVANLSSLAIDSSGVVWIGAQNILYKYDHGNWELIDTILQLQLNIAVVSDIEISGEGDVWICIYRGFGAYSNGLYNYNNGWIYGIPGTYDPGRIFIDELDNLWVTFINFWPHQMLWNKIGKYDGSDWEVIDIFGAHGLRDLVVRNDTIFVTTYFGDLKAYADTTWQFIIPHEEWLVEKVWKYENRIWIGGEKFCEFYGDTLSIIEPITEFLYINNSRPLSLRVENDQILWIGTNNGHLIKFIDSLDVVTGYTGNAIVDIEIDKYNNKWVLINNVGLLLFNEDGILDVKNNFKYSPYGLVLSHNHPNPFNPITTIKYQIPDLSFVSLKIYDILGNEITTLVNEEKPAGTYEVEFAGTGLPSGIYFYQLRAGSFVEIKKMVLMK
jgi:hypothetical protein